MNINRKPIFTISELPQLFKVTWQGMDISTARAHLRVPGDQESEFPLAWLSFTNVTEEGADILLPESLECLGEGRYEIVLSSNCVPCADIQLEFKSDCKITRVINQPLEAVTC